MELSINNEVCKQAGLALRDAIELLSGKWKFCILLNLSAHKTMRFKELQETISGISPKVLSRELQDLEQNLLLTRTVNNTRPVTVSYTLTEYAAQVQPVLNALVQFGLTHRNKILEN